jgi:hypothetical protein
MIVASSKDDNCIRKLMHFLELSYPGVPFKITISYTSRIEIDDKVIEMWENANRGIFREISLFCDGYTIGWEAATQ